MNSRASAFSLVMLAAVALLCGCVAQPPLPAYDEYQDQSTGEQTLVIHGYETGVDLAMVEPSCSVGEPGAQPVSIDAARRLLTQCRTGARRSYLPWQIGRMFR